MVFKKKKNHFIRYTFFQQKTLSVHIFLGKTFESLFCHWLPSENLWFVFVKKKVGPDSIFFIFRLISTSQLSKIVCRSVFFCFFNSEIWTYIIYYKYYIIIVWYYCLGVYIMGHLHNYYPTVSQLSETPISPSNSTKGEIIALF